MIPLNALEAIEDRKGISNTSRSLHEIDSFDDANDKLYSESLSTVIIPPWRAITFEDEESEMHLSQSESKRKEHFKKVKRVK